MTTIRRISDNEFVTGGVNDDSEWEQSEFEDNTSAGTPPKSNLDSTSDEIAKLAKTETRNVRMWRRNVFLMLLITAALVTSLTYMFLKAEDEEDFSTSFHQFASTIQDSLKFNILGVLEATSGLGEYFTAEAIQTNSIWPFVTLSSFEVYVSHTRAQASSELIVVAPFVSANELDDWADYSIQHQGWIDESFAAMPADDRERFDWNAIPSSIYRFGRFKGRTVLKPEDGASDYPAAPFWQMSRPPFDTSIINFNALSTEEYQEIYTNMMSSRRWVLGVAGPNTLIDYTISQQAHDELHSATRVKNEQSGNTNSNGQINNNQEQVSGFANDHPHTALVYPVFRELNNINSDIVAMVVNILPWDNYLKNALPDGVDGIYCVLHNSLGQVFTYVINGQDATYLGEGDFHDPSFDDMQVLIEFDDFINTEDGEEQITSDDAGGGGHHYWFAVYPSQELESEYKSGTPTIFAVVALAAFAMMTFTFVLYDWYVIRKNNKILDAASRSNAILSSLFPKDVKNKLLMEEEAKKNAKGEQWAIAGDMLGYMDNQDGRNSGDGLYGDGDDDDEIKRSKPIADLFPEATVLFADLVGFTAWSSTREPTSVFILLETLFNAFDKVAARKRVYKVETIGDCYVAVTGLPEPNPKHAEAMCKFAREIFLRMQQLTTKLEEKLGPDTSNLSMRFGLHSGPVTAGVLRGERSRFQLFGDTMNTASRMESTGKPGRIQLSQTTADLLVAAGKGHWVEKREEKIVAKGKGEMQTFWLVQSSRPGSVTSMTESAEVGKDLSPNAASGSGKSISETIAKDRTRRLIQWNVSCFSTLLQSIAARRHSQDTRDMTVDDRSHHTESTEPTSKIPLEEVTEVIDLSVRAGPAFNSFTFLPDPESIELIPQVRDELADYITVVSTLYNNNNSFHCFQHASHVVMSVLKLFSRFQNCSNGNNITGNSPATTTTATTALDSSTPPTIEEIPLDESGRNNRRCFTSDPLIQFACAFSALIHDIQHPGVSNEILIQEEPDVAEHYKNRSVAEQRSLDVAWELLMEDKYSALRGAIYQNGEEKERFRQLVVNSLLATDVMDPELRKLRTDRWNRAFSDEDDNNSHRSQDRKATIIIEHLIQTSDVSHTMQHWSVFRKWNERLFEEMHKAYMDGRTDKDPSEFWYKGEISFFDFYVIPLAERLQECGERMGVVRGSDEYLTYAKKNRKEWEEKGERIVKEMQAKCMAKHNNNNTNNNHDSSAASASSSADDDDITVDDRDQ